jgi:PAS domain S-box-containing protein
MTYASAALPNSYDYGQVARSVLIAIAASYAGLDLAGRVTAAKGWIRLAWLSGGAVAMGIGIWAMHLKGMLAYRLAVPVEYHWPTLLAALLLATLASAVALYATSRQKMGWAEALNGSIIMGAGIAGLHYFCMAAMRLPAVARYSPSLVAVSILLATLFSLIALLMAFGLREETRGTIPRRLGSAILMGAAISAMHYTGMAAATFISASPPDLSHSVSISPLGNYGVSMVTLILIAAALITSSVDRRAEAEVRKLNLELERRVGDRTLELTAANAKLAESEERFRKVVEALPDAVLVHGKNKILFVNPSCMRLLGAQQPEQLLGKDVLEILHPDYREAVEQCIQYCLETGIACPAKESIFLTLDGSEVPIEAAAIAIRWKGSQAIEVIFRDIRQRKQAEEKLREYEKVVEGLEEMIVVVDRDYRYVLANRAILNRHGLQGEQLLGRQVSQVLNEGVFETLVKEKLDECFHGNVVQYEMKYTYPQFGERDLSVSYFPIEGPTGVDRAACVMQDITERKRAENALRASEERSRRLVQNSSVAMIVSRGMEQKVELMNDRFTALFGYTVEDVPDVAHWWPLAYPDETYRQAVRNEWQARVEKAIGSGTEIAPMETTVRCKDGSIRHIEAYLSCMGNTNLVTLIDLTERKRAEQSLRLFRMLVDHSNDAIEVIEPETHRFVDINERACVDLGYSREELLSKSVYDIDPAAGESRFARVGEDLLKSGSAIFESVHRRKDGSTFPVEVSIKQAHLDRIYRISVVRDITERKRAEKSLLLFRMLADQSNDAIEVVDSETLHFIDINDRACIDLGYTREELLSMSIYDIDPNVDESMHARVRNELRESGSAIFESLHRRKDGSTFPVEVSVKQVQLDRSYMVSATRDITERKQAENALQQARAELARVTRFAAMGELTASIAHEINQPLAAVVTNGSASLRWLATQPPNLEEAREAIKGAVREANRASDVIGRIRALLQKAPPLMERLDMNAVVREVLTLADSELIRGGVTVRTELAADVPAVLGDHVQLRQVMLNLILNGIDAMSAITDRPRELRVKSARHPDGVLVQVRDSGHGVDAEQADRIFESLFTTKPQGIGVGLSLSRSIVEAHGGHLWMDPGACHGAVFQFTVPQADGIL